MTLKVKIFILLVEQNRPLTTEQISELSGIKMTVTASILQQMKNEGLVIFFKNRANVSLNKNNRKCGKWHVISEKVND